MRLAERTFRRKDYVKPVGRSRYGWRLHPITGQRQFHYGEDYATGGQKWPLYALESGTVEHVGFDNINGNNIWIKYPRIDLKVFLGHLDVCYLKAGQRVNDDTLIGLTGTTGRSSGIHLHMGVQRNRRYFNHADYEYVEEVKFATDLKTIENSVIKVGDMVKMMGSVWATGQRVPLWVKLRKYEVVRLNERSALLDRKSVV